jgi:hypothetical protein
MRTFLYTLSSEIAGCSGVAMDFLAWKMLVIILHKQNAVNGLNIKIASLFCTLYVHYETISSGVAFCDGIAKKQQAILRSSEWQFTFLEFSKYFTHL